MNPTPIVTRVEFAKSVERQLRKLPVHIQNSPHDWAATVERTGIRSTRLVKGYHDEPLHGERRGQRSVRLNKSYRAIYVETVEGIRLLIIEVTKHAY